ncbi:hypothetical protein Tco_0442798 [Tanacetum coccineum]
MSTSNQQTLADSRANERPPMLEKGNYIPWESRFRRFLDNKLEEGEQMLYSIKNGSYKRPLIPDPDGALDKDGNVKQAIEPLSKMTEGDTKQYIADVRVMNYLLQAIPNDIYNSVDACKNAKETWERMKRLMFGSEVTSHVRHSRLMDEFENFAAKEGESLESVYERLTMLVNIMDRNNVRPIQVSTNTVTFHIFRELQGDSQEDKLIIAMILLARSITQKFSTPTNNHFRTSPNTRNQAVIQDGRVDIQTKNPGYAGNGNMNAGRQSMNQAFNAVNGNNDNIQIVQRQYARDCLKPRVHNAKYFREQMLLAMKDEAESILNNKENDFMLDTSYDDATIEELTAAAMLMARIQPANGNIETVPSYDAKDVSEVNASSKVHEQVSHERNVKTIIQTTDD